MPKITSGNTAVPAIMIGEKASDIIKSTIECEYQEAMGRQYLFPTAKFNASSFDFDYDHDEDEILFSPEVKDNLKGDYDYPSYYTDTHNNGHKKKVYPNEVKFAEEYFDDPRKRSFYPSMPNYKLCHGSPTCRFEEYMPSWTQNWDKYFGNTH